MGQIVLFPLCKLHTPLGHGHTPKSPAGGAIMRAAFSLMALLATAGKKGPEKG